MFLDKVILLSAIAASVYANLPDTGIADSDIADPDMTEEEAIENTNCVFNLLCLKKYQQLLRLPLALKNEEVMRDVLGFLGETYDVPFSGDLDDLDDTLASAHRIICEEMPYKDRIAKSAEYASYMGEKMEDNKCTIVEESEDNPFCQALKSATEEMKEILNDNQASGNCCDKNEPDSERCQEDAKMAAEL